MSRPDALLTDAYTGHLPPLPPAVPILPLDSSLDPAQLDAVARIVGAPELVVLEGPVGTGKTRVVAEAVRQLVRQGRRILLTSPDLARLDRMLPALAVDVSLVRRMGPGESIDTLPEEVAVLTEVGRRETLRASLLAQANEAVAAAGRRLSAANDRWSLWQELEAAMARHREMQAEQAESQAVRDDLPDAVRRDADQAAEPIPYYIQRLRGFASTRAKKVAGLDAEAATLQAGHAQAEGERLAAEKAFAEAEAVHNAKSGGRWFRLSYWKGGKAEDAATLFQTAQERLAAAKGVADDLAVRLKKIDADRQLAENEHAAERDKMLAWEVSRRATDIDAKLAELAPRVEATAAELEACRQRIGEVSPAARVDADESRRIAAEEQDFARTWADHVAGHLDAMVEEACGRPQVVAGPIEGLDDSFDLLIVDDAHRLTETAYLAAAAHAERWALVGEGPPPRGRSGKPEVFARLGSAFSHETWVHEGDRLVCRLHRIRASERRRLECEPVADSPDVELRLFTPPGGDPLLAEVAFTPSVTPTAAREFLLRELGEVTLQARGRTPIWSANDAGRVARLSPLPTTANAEVGPGIIEELHDLDTVAVRFGPEWSADDAEAWLATHLSARDGGRLIRLHEPHRACPGLALWLNAAFAYGFRPPVPATDAAHVEFLAMPDLDRRGPPRSHRVGGAGYEIDLADPRSRSALPGDHADLPTRGFVNLQEAQALLRHLEGCSGEWVVTSPFPAQVMVLRRMAMRSPRTGHIRVVDPADAAQGECDQLAVSLTRSHVSRAVTFGESPAILSGVLGRVRRRVLFAGDPGTLARRLQWEGPVDHLDAADSARERGWVAALADCPRVSRSRQYEGTRA